jgi:cathepsin L
MIRNKVSVDSSEQYVVSNNDNKAGACEKPGGLASLASEFLVTNGTTSETIMPDTGVTGTPDASIEIFYKALTWGWVDPDNYSSPSAQKIKESVCKYGGVASWIDAGGTFKSYIGGDDASTDVYDDDDDKAADYPGKKGHAVSIIGWDDARGAWLVRNSWGQNWGFEAGFGSESGYGWVKQGTHGIGSYVSWVQAQGAVYPLPRRYYDLMPMKRLPTQLPTTVVKPPTVNRPPPIRRP